MVIANITPATVQHVADVAGAIAILFLIGCGVVLVRGLTRRPLGAFAQVLLNIRLVVTTLLVILVIPLLGWLVFAALLILLLVYVLAFAGMPTRVPADEINAPSQDVAMPQVTAPDTKPGYAEAPQAVTELTIPLPAHATEPSSPAEPVTAEQQQVAMEWPTFEWPEPDAAATTATTAAGSTPEASASEVTTEIAGLDVSGVPVRAETPNPAPPTAAASEPVVPPPADDDARANGTEPDTD
jgi:hypothetical protein